jgi:hypothetical protein
MKMNRMAGLALLAGLVPFASTGQAGGSDELALRIRELHEALWSADTLVDDVGMNDSMSASGEIERRLKRVLDIPMADSTLERATEHPSLGRARSPDGRFWTFCWGVHSGGTFQRNVCWLLYRDEHGKTIGYGYPSICVDGAGIGRIHMLRTKKVQGQLYLLEGSVVGCGSCLTNVLTVLRLNGDTLDLAYPAFQEIGNDGQPTGGSTPCYSMDAYYNDFIQFEYNERRQELTYVFRTDELTPVQVELGQARGTVRGTLRFDGVRFIERVGKLQVDPSQ